MGGGERGGDGRALGGEVAGQGGIIARRFRTPNFKNGEHMAAAVGQQQIVGVFNPLGDGRQPADSGKPKLPPPPRRNFPLANFGKNRHLFPDSFQLCHKFPIPALFFPFPQRWEGEMAERRLFFFLGDGVMLSLPKLFRKFGVGIHCYVVELRRFRVFCIGKIHAAQSSPLKIGV